MLNDYRNRLIYKGKPEEKTRVCRKIRRIVAAEKTSQTIELNRQIKPTLLLEFWES